MNKQELVSRVATATGLENRTVKNTLETLLNTVSENLCAGEKVKLVGFGTFRTTRRRPRPAINLKTMEKITLPERRVVIFTPGVTLRQNLNRD
jgi:nucleoid DNA-binding protein